MQYKRELAAEKAGVAVGPAKGKKRDAPSSAEKVAAEEKVRPAWAQRRSPCSQRPPQRPSQRLLRPPTAPGAHQKPFRLARG